MAYKFQRGKATLSGSITAEEGFDAGDAKLENVSEISNAGGDVLISATANSGNAFRISSSAGVFMRYDSGTGAEAILFEQGLVLDDNQDTLLRYDETGGVGKERVILATSGALGAVGEAMAWGQGLNTSFNSLLMSGSQELQLFDSNSTVSGDGNEVTFKAGGTAGVMKVKDGFLELKNTSKIGTTIDTNLLTLGNGILTVDGEVSMTTLDIGGTDVTATADELNYNDITTLGTSEASKVVTADANGDITLAGASSNIVFDKSANALEFADNSKITFGTGDDASIYWDGSNLNIGVEASATPILIGNATSEVTIQDNLTINGNLTILGATVSASVETLIIQDALINIGDGRSTYDDGYGIEFGTSGSSWASLKTAQVGGNNHLSSSLPLAAPSFYGDGSNLTGVAASGLTLSAQTITSTATINKQLVLLDSNGGSFTATLPAVADNVGQLYVIKDSTGDCATNSVVIEGNASETIDSELNVTLESSYAAISLFGTSGGWIIV